MCDPQKLDRVGSGMQNCIHESIIVKVITRCKSVVQLNQSVSNFTVHVHVFRIAVVMCGWTYVRLLSVNRFT